MALRDLSRVVALSCAAMVLPTMASAQLVTTVTPSQFPVGSNTTALLSITNAGQQTVPIPYAMQFEFVGPLSLLQPSGSAVVTVVSRTGLVSTQFLAGVSTSIIGNGNTVVVIGCALNPYQNCFPLTLAPGDSINASITLAAGSSPGATVIRPTGFSMTGGYLQPPAIPVAVTDFDGVSGFTPPGALVMLPAGVQPPLGYTFVGSFQQSLRPSAAGANGGGAEVKVQINVYRKN